ncbi:MAG: DUF456 domain-containing protein [Bacteroidales bacterium]|jgi:uncharacterized protein YqgC (DUF456 family)|nr:DUF456 domain-containing protein [Bacteroidales bacterium]MBR3526371.1 DUF456 domain-containing protein [Bacteroidales bacterium]MCR5828110.1 DUF456 domain-containing protein [Bacteroidales bacterium]
MDVFCVFALILGLVGIVGSIIPALPGPPLSWVGLLLVYFSGQRGVADPMTLRFLMIWLAVTVIVTIFDYFVPAWFTKVTGGHKAASVGAMIGLFIGMFSPFGIILGSLAGAFLGEFLFEKRGVWDSFKASLGAFLGFMSGTGAKLIVSGILFYDIIKYVF